MFKCLVRAIVLIAETHQIEPFRDFHSENIVIRTEHPPAFVDIGSFRKLKDRVSLIEIGNQVREMLESLNVTDLPEVSKVCSK